MKRALCGLLAAASLSLPARAARTIPVQVDGRHLPGVSYVDSGVTYVPLRTLLDTLGGWEIWWDSTEKMAVATSADHDLAADPDENRITINGVDYSGRVTVENGRTYVPLRLVAEALGGSAEWDRYMDGAAMTSPGAAYDAVELYWLSRVISAESGAEPLNGQIAVGNVVLNRVESETFPNTIPAVVFDRNFAVQFEPVENGTIYNPPTAQSVTAAKRALDGESVVGKALYFYAPALSQGIWINANRPYLTTIGCHRFYL
ncbi:MAG: cell wall hydrolase [Ruminococcaceae bacterium]|nr:cell wall hydrolase [Oscillospiraceae bacterium]